MDIDTTADDRREWAERFTPAQLKTMERIVGKANRVLHKLRTPKGVRIFKVKTVKVKGAKK